MRKLAIALCVVALPFTMLAASPAAADITPRTYSGVGDDVIPVRLTENGLIRVRSDGTENFAIWTLNRRGNKKELLVNTIGSYRGVVAFEAGARRQRVAAIQVMAVGPWTLRVKPMVGARNWRDRSTNGVGDNVLQVFNRKLTLKATYEGESNFAVWALDGDGDKIDLLVNTIGDYSGRTAMPSRTRYLIINAGSGDPWRVVKR